MLIISTKQSGKIAVIGVKGLIIFIDCIIPIIKKYKFEGRIRSMNKTFGKKVTNEYLVVLMWFVGKIDSGVDKKNYRG
jgi:hypothetical protein